MAHGDKPAGHPVHFCDGCDAAIIERPLLDVLFDIAGSA